MFYANQSTLLLNFTPLSHNLWMMGAKPYTGYPLQSILPLKFLRWFRISGAITFLSGISQSYQGEWKSRADVKLACQSRVPAEAHSYGCGLASPSPVLLHCHHHGPSCLHCLQIFDKIMVGGVTCIGSEGKTTFSLW